MEAKKSNHQANIVRVAEILPHTNADSLEIIPIGGYQVVVKKGQFKTGDLAVYIQPDSVVPQTEPFRFIWGQHQITEMGNVTPESVSERRRRITVRKFRKEWSEGLLLPISDFSGGLHHEPKLAYGWLKEGDDVSDLLGITHYDPDKGRESTTGDNERSPGYSRWPRSLKGWYYFILRKLGLRSKNNEAMYRETGIEFPVYDVEAFKNFKRAFEPGEQVVVTEKIHGSNARYLFLNGHMFAGSRTLWKSEKSPCVWRKALSQNPWIETWCRAHPGYVLYGEVTPTQKGFNYGKDDVQFFVFDIRTPEGTWMEWIPSWPDTYEMLQGLTIVPVLYTGPFDAQKIIFIVDGPSTVPGAKHIREGLVIKAVRERQIRGLGRVQLKVVSNAFLEKDNK